LEASGLVHAIAQVHRHHADTPTTPFTVAIIVLDAGPTLKAVLVGDTEATTVGSRVVGVSEVTGTDDNGNNTVELRFELSHGFELSEGEAS
jgi:uncharacterized OB-fold protein